MWTYGFFNNINGDRLYNADQLSSIFEGLITSGVYESVGNKLAVQPNDGMTIQINTGRGWFGGRWVNNDGEYLLNLEASDIILNRYCAVCIRVDQTAEGRKAEPYLKYSDFASTPVKPTMERNEDIKEYCLAYIYIPAGVSAITATHIEDTRANTELCGWVTGLIEQIDSTTLFEQFENIFKDWMNSLGDYVSENAEAQLIADMANVKPRTPKKAVGRVEGNDWVLQNDGTYQQTISIEGITDDNDIIVIPTESSKEAYLNVRCQAIGQGDNTLILSCTRPTTDDFYVKVIIFDDVISI